MSVHKKDLTLASGSSTRARLLRDAGLEIGVIAPTVDEVAIREKLRAIDPSDLSAALADAKAREVASEVPGLVLGCDQVLALGNIVFAKPCNEADARSHLTELSGRTHRLFSAAVLYEDGAPVWQTVGEVTLQMRALSQDYIADFVTRNWDSIRHSVGAYTLEEEGARFFTKIKGDYFTVLGLPLLDLLSHLANRGLIRT